MHRPWLAPLTILFWCVTTTWLVVDKILPTLLPGSPPGYQALYASNNRLIPVAWTVLWQDQPLGWAVSESHRAADESVTVKTSLHFDRLPLDKLLPSWTKPIVGRALERSAALAFDARGRLAIDPQGRLVAFSSVVDLPGGIDSVMLDGTVDDGHVKIRVKAGELSYEASRFLPSHIMIGDELAPQATMSGLAPGKRWTVPVYNPLRGGTSALEVLHAEVAGEETLFWEDRLVRVDLVVYRDDPSGHHDPCCRIWVDRSGRVLKQESMLLGSSLTFMRRSDAAAEEIATRLAAEESGTP
ncbi:MAG: hypothetical protein EBR28_05630 [Planctomycetia bacterium]|nr:hypothetical protein [Planctomycetia bacterium]